MHKALFTTLLVTLGTSLAVPAFASDSGEAAFELLSKYSWEKKKKNFIKLKSSIDKSDAMAIDAKISKLYGEPKISRGGLKVWEVPNENGSGAKHTTIMCGPDTSGGIFISADRRGPTGRGAASRSKTKKSKNVSTSREIKRRTPTQSSKRQNKPIL